MSDATRAFERGDFALARKLARGSSDKGDEKEIFRRTGPDPLIARLALGCVALFVILVYAFGHGS
jgi:hypothetical protein